MSEEELNVVMAAPEKPNVNRLAILQGLFTTIENELKRVGVTKQTAWSETRLNTLTDITLLSFVSITIIELNRVK